MIPPPLAHLFRVCRIEPMAKGDYLGEFELYVLAALVRLGDNAYGMTVRVEIETRGRRPASIGSVYATLDRLAEKGYVEFVLSPPVADRDGRARKFARITPSGRKALRQSAASIARIFSGLGYGLKADS